MDTFKSGDVVKIKSGGPLMTVMETDKKGQKVYCCWFNKDERYDSTEFSRDMLTKIDSAANE